MTGPEPTAEARAAAVIAPALTLDFTLPAIRAGADRAARAARVAAALAAAGLLAPAADDLRARVEALLNRWAKDREGYPPTAAGNWSAAVVRLCERELRAALTATAQPAGGEV